MISKKLFWKAWLIIFSLKLLFATVFCQLVIYQYPERQIGAISYASGDYDSYIQAMENYATKHKYYFLNQQMDTVRAGRAPHFALPYLAARQFTSKESAGDFLSVFNIVIDSFAILCMALLASGMLNSLLAFWLSIIIGIGSTYVSNWTFITLPDAPAAGLLMIGYYFFWRAWVQKGKIFSDLFGASLFFCWAVMLRPYLVVIVGLLALMFLIKKRLPLREYGKLVLSAGIPIVFVILPWPARNYSVIGKPVIFQQDVYAGYNYYPSELATRKFMTALGNDGGTFWNPATMAAYFSPHEYCLSTYSYPGYLKKDIRFIDSIERVRTTYISNYGNRSESEEKSLASRASALRLMYIHKYPLRYFILNPMERLARFWGHSGSYHISSVGVNQTIIGTIKVTQSVLYFLVLIIGTIGLIKLSKREIFGLCLLLPLLTISILLPILFGFMEPRYGMAFYYPGIIGVMILGEPLMRKFWLRKKV
jgi:hypothetical protein